VTDTMPIICRRCGFANVPGDQFCGSCGSFLEWEGLPAAGEPAAGEPAGGPGVDALSRQQVAQPAPPPTAQPGTPTAAPAAAVAAGLVRCPACGIANPATRTFCQSCGTTLAQASRVAEPSAAAIAAAVARPASVPRAATAPVAGAALRAAAAPSRGFPTWILVIGGLGILVGIAAVAASMLLGGKAPGSGATTVPGSGAIVSGAPTTGNGGASGEPSGGPSASAAPVEIALKTAKASSVIGNRSKFSADKAIDGDPTTCWQEGKTTEKGQWIEVTFARTRVTSVTLYNGYELSDDAYFANLRLKDVEVSVNGGKAIPIRLKDAKGPQQFELGSIAGATRMRITIVSTYASKKTAFTNSPFDDAALGEIVVEGVPE
jgi:hypothetical protein